MEHQWQKSLPVVPDAWKAIRLTCPGGGPNGLGLRCGQMAAS